MKKHTIFLILLLVSASVCQAQVSCSSAVDQSVCKGVSGSFNAFLPANFHVTVLTQVEFDKRLSDLKEEEKNNTTAVGGDWRAMQLANADKSPFFTSAQRRVLYGQFTPGNALLLREKPQDKRPSEAVISEEVFETKVYLDDNGNPIAPPSFDIDASQRVLVYLLGYLDGSISTALDGSVTFDLNQ